MRWKSAEPPETSEEWAFALRYETARRLRAGLLAYPGLLERCRAGDREAADEAWALGRDLAELGRTLTLRNDEVQETIPQRAVSPLRALPAMMQVTAALVGLTLSPIDERAQLSREDLDRIVDRDGLGDWILDVLDTARDAEEARRDAR
jgi:hypothetical protein